MKKAIPVILISLFMVVSCSPQVKLSKTTETSPPATSTVAPINPTETMMPTPTIQLASSTVKPTIQAPKVTLTPVPHDFVTKANLDGTWYFEFESSPAKTIKIYQKDDLVPVVDLDLFAYYPDYPDTSYPVFETFNSPVALGWYDPVWSPDGRYLAFLGAIEGPSSDLYVFDTGSQTITRLTRGENQAVKPEWSPDSRWIIHGEMFDSFLIDGYNAFWAARPDGSENRWLFDPKGWTETFGWVGDNTFYIADSCMLGYFVLRLIDIDRGDIITAFDLSGDSGGCVGSVQTTFAFDPKSGALVYNLSLLDEVTEYEGGFYLTTPWAPTARLMIPEKPGRYKWVNAWDEELGLFVTQNNCDDNESLYSAITPQGEVFCIEY